MVMAAQLYEYNKNHWLVHFKWVTYMICGLYLNKASVKTVILVD